MEGGLKRMGAVFLKFWAVPMVPLGVGLMLYGLAVRDHDPDDTFRLGVSLAIVGAAFWFMAERLAAGARLARHRRQQNRVLRLARECGGRLTVTEAAMDTGLTVEDAEQILRQLADGGVAEVEVTESGMVVYRFTEIVYSHEKAWSRGVLGA